MRLRQLENWLDDMGWQPEPRKGGSLRAWIHPAYPNQRLTYHAPHKNDNAELRPDVVTHIYDDLVMMRPAEDEQEQENQEAS